MQQLKMDLVTKKKQTEEKLTKPFRSELLEFARLELRRQVPTSSTSMLSRLVMTTSLTLAGVPRAVELSKADHSQQYVEKKNEHSKT